MNTRKLLSLITPAVALALLPLGASPGVAAAQTAGCLGTSNETVYHLRSVSRNQWTAYYYDTATSNCRDFNVKVTDHPASCEVEVDAEYLKNGVWTNGARGLISFHPNEWEEPITSLADGTRVRARFRFVDCGDSSVRIHLAA